MPSPVPLARAHRSLAAVLAVLVLVMAVTAGRSLFGTWDIEVHGWIGNAVFALTLANVAVAVAARAARADLVVAVVIVVLTFAQVGLGYVGREEIDAAALHVPNGVLLMALTTYQWSALRFRPLAAA